MENLADLLYEYSKTGSKVDKVFIDKAIVTILKDRNLKEYIKKICFDNLSNHKINHNGKFVPMAYNVYTKELLLDFNNIALFSNEIESMSKSSKFSNFERILLDNAIILQVLLHEIEHANQHRKSNIENESFENLLLRICHYVDNEIFKESKLSQLLIIKKGVFLNSQLHHSLNIMQQLNSKYGTSLPTERMANIYSVQSVIDILTQINKDINIENVIPAFKALLIGFWLNGYNFNDENISSPTERYLKDVKQLNITGIDMYFGEEFYQAKRNSENSSLEERLLLGLPINLNEYQKIRRM